MGNVKYEDIIRWIREEIEPIPDLCGRKSFRCSVYLKDGLYLPCVLFREARAQTELAMKRFDDCRDNGVTDPSMIYPGHYPTVVETFVTQGNRVSVGDVATVESSPYVIPVGRLREIRGETRMSWTAFAAVMDDGEEFSFGTAYGTEFFNMPTGYSGERIVTIIPHKNERQPVYRDRPFFDCFVERMDFGKA